MDPEAQASIIRKILSPNPECAAELLESLGIAEPPSRERIHAEIEQKLLLPKQKLPDHWLSKYQIYWQNELSIPSLIKHEPSPQPTCLSFIRTGLDGRVTGYTEASNPRLSTGLTSTSLERAPGPSKNFVRGKAGNVPFWPGGLEDPSSGIPDELEEELLGEAKGLRTVPPGFTRGLRLPGEDEGDAEFDGLDRVQKPLAAGQGDAPPSSRLEPDGPPLIGTSEIDELLPTSRALLAPLSAAHRSTRRARVQKREWARVVDINKPMKKFHELVPDMAHRYPFELDTFQKEAVYHLEMGDSVFVAAHTSAGKTVVAEYAIALASKHMTRAIYTSPIKALSNQKFRDFKQTFGSSSVGILTGDVQINPEANCLIMTTEILRSMLYKGADLIRDVEFVIFDEVHYVNDAERGVVWEEVIIMLPDHVNIILLSATVPNTKEFAEWVGRTKKKDIYVISTAKRPVPLEHYLYAGRELWKIVDASRNFLGPGYKDAGEALRRKQDKEREAAGLPPVQRLGAHAAAPQRGARGLPTGRGGPPARGRGQITRGAAPSRGGAPARFNHDKTLYVHLMGHLKKKSLLPVVVFTLSKKRCEENASTLTNLDLCTSTDKSEVHVAIEKALGRLKDSDRKLPQIKRMRDLLSRGIGVHHGGLLPLVKEIVEILFARGLVKVLFATETFAMGVNMPAKCVVFSGIRKHDGRNFREILPGEYTQMAGRAGRRGLDTTGTVIITIGDELPEQRVLHQMILGPPSKLKSQFRLTYNMILNLLRVEALRVEEMIKRSFSENESQMLLPDQQKQVVEGEKELSRMRRLDCSVCLPDIEECYDTTVNIIEHNQRLLSMAADNPHGAKLLSSGRVVILRDGHFNFNIGVLLKPIPERAPGGARMYWVLAVVDSHTKSGKDDKAAEVIAPRWSHSPEEMLVDQPEYELAKIPLTSVSLVTMKTIKVEAESIVERHIIRPMRATVELLEDAVRSWVVDSQRRSPDWKIPEVDWGRMKSLDFQETLQYRRVLERINCNRSCLLCPSFDAHYEILHGEKFLREQLANLRVAISGQNLELIPDYEQRLDVLRELRFIDENSTVLLKGRVACEINSANELVLTELILENTLGGYEPEEVVALLSCFVFQEKTDAEPTLTPRLESGRDAIVAIADRVGAVQDLCKVVAEEHRTDLKFGLMEVVYEWAKGMPFDKIMPLTDVAEGTIVRVITRLDETCREVRDAARVIGDADLFKKMEEAQNKIKRDIVFAASLYF